MTYVEKTTSKNLFHKTRICKAWQAPKRKNGMKIP